MAAVSGASWIKRDSLSLSLSLSFSLFFSLFMLRLSLLCRNEKLSTPLYGVFWDSRVYFYSAKDLENIFSFYGNGWERLELWILYFFLFLSCEDEFGGVTNNNKMELSRIFIWNFYLEFLRILWRLDDAFVQSLIHKSLKIGIFR